MEEELASLLEKVDHLRDQLILMAQLYSLTHPKVIELSTELDKLILEVQRLIHSGESSIE